jgi:predicted TIM-barrel fold metal-dependent hydrolase
MTVTKIVDAHLHLSPQVSGDAATAARSLADDLAASHIERGIVLHLQTQPWEAAEFAEALAPHPRLRGFINVHPGDTGAIRQLRDGVEKLRFIGLKLHPRLQRFDLKDSSVIRLVAAAGEIGIPVLIDAFPDGDWLMMGFDPLAFAGLAKACPEARIVIAHFGGHHCLDLMMLAKRLPNVWFDLSFSLLYYAGSPVVGNLLYCCRSMDYRRIMYGSDYPDRSVGAALALSMMTFSNAGIAGDHLNALTWRNAAECFGWTDV